MRKTILLLKAVVWRALLPALLPAQTIDIELPWYAGRDYYFFLPQGTQQDTIATGRLGYGGKAVIDLSATHASYCGVGRFGVEGFGKRWNIIINTNEHIRLSEPDAEEAQTTFEGSAENSFLLAAMARQSRIIQDYQAAASPSEGQPLVLALPRQRMQAVGDEYRAFRQEIAASPLYAARIMEILGCLAGVGSSFDASTDDVLEEQREFVARKVDFDDLYTSGFWQMAFDVWVQAASIIAQADDSLLLGDSRHMLDRCGDIPLRREVTQMLIRQFSKYGKEYLLAGLGAGFITLPLTGELAPQIVTPDGSFLPENSLIVFYETGCGSCHYELEALKSKYKLLTDNHIRVISVAADIGEAVFEETAAKLPWADKLCDLKGFEGDNFRNYGIVGTPTYILTDSGGIVRGRYAQLKELLK